MTFVESNTVEQMILDLVAGNARGVAPGSRGDPGHGTKHHIVHIARTLVE